MGEEGKNLQNQDYILFELSSDIMYSGKKDHFETHSIKECSNLISL